MIVKHPTILGKIIGYAARHNMDVTIDTAVNLSYRDEKYRVKDNPKDLKKLLSGELEPIKNFLNYQEVMDVVYKHFNTSHEEVTRKHSNGKMSRYPEVVMPRQVIYHFCKIYTDLSGRKMGELIYQQPHDVVLHSIKVVNNLTDSNGRFRELIAKINNELIELQNKIG